MRTGNAIYLIEADPGLTLVREYIAAKQRVTLSNAAIAQELGIREATTHFDDGRITSVVFDKEVPPGWTKPSGRHRTSWPKRGSFWEKRLAQQPRLPSQVDTIAKAFGVPLQIEYANDDSEGFSMIGGNPFQPCGFLFLSADGPYALWIPNVPEAVAHEERLGFRVAEPAKSFSMELPGCRRLMPQEWDLMVAQHKLDKARAEKARAAA